jgi:glutathionylspermidine synthase
MDDPKNLAGLSKSRCSRARRQPYSPAGQKDATNRRPYEEEGFVYQALGRIPDLGGAFPVIGSWMINGAAASIRIRESETPVTNNLSRFVPHLFE